MTTVGRPKVRIAVPDIDGANVDEKRREELTTKGTKRKRAPPTKGPCEHGVKHRSACKVCSACPHGRQRSKCKECGGKGICEHGRRRSQCKECGGASNLRARSSALSMQGVRWVSESASTVVYALSARSAVGHRICEHGRHRSYCKECGGASICEHGRRRTHVQGVRWVINLRARSFSALSARSAVGDRSASTVVGAHVCKECGGSGICEHGRVRTNCKECGGASICEHGRQRSHCKECGGSQICEHGRQRSQLQGVRWVTNL